MSLEGNLTAFGLSEILQLIAVQQKSGVLSISRQSSSMKLFFRDGKVVSTRDRRRSARDPLKDFLTRYGVISREELARLTEISTQSKLDLTEVIVSEGLLDEEEMRAHCKNHVQETIHDILTWEQCSYRFIPGTDVIDGLSNWGEFGIEGLLMESMRRIDEFPQMIKEFPDGGMSVTKRGEPAGDQELSAAESAILGMLSSQKTINDLVAHARIPRFDTYEALKTLKEKGLIDVETSQILEPELDIGKRWSEKPRVRRRRNPLPLMVSILVFIGATAWGARDVVPRLKRGILERSIGALTLSNTPPIRSQIESELRWSLEIYRAKRGSYPVRLKSLVDSGITSDSFLEKVRVLSFRYYLTPEGSRYTLL